MQYSKGSFPAVLIGVSLVMAQRALLEAILTGNDRAINAK